MKPKDPDTFIDIGVSITRLLLIASGQGTAASLIGEGAGLLRNLGSLLGSGGQRAVSAEKIAADVAARLPRESWDISEADWQVAATNVAPLIDRLSEKDRLAAGYDWTALHPVLLDLGGKERQRKLADESARRAFDWVLDVACQHITDCFTAKEALASLIREVNETKSGVRQLLNRPAGASKTRDIVIEHIKALRELAPDHLEDRESEMADLEAFVCRSDDVWYAMEADMVSGKTAVMASFALKFAMKPPEGAHMASFFIRSFGGDGSGRGSFAFVMGAQLANILGDDYTEAVRDPRRHVEFCKLLRRAATACRSETVPRPLVLLIDGIDEDSYFENPDGVDTKSILSLLPPHLPEGVKIITASRPNPRLPEDVQCVAKRKKRIVSLKPSPIAEKSIDIKNIKTFFKSDIAVDIGAFLAACGGVLTVKDLSKLLTIRRSQRISDRDVRTCVDHSSGRMLTPVNVGFGDQEVLAYRLGHTVVVRVVIRELDPDSFGEGDGPEDEHRWAQIREKALAPYRVIIRDWVKECASRGWGENTPSYVLSGACFDLMLNDKRDDSSSIRVVLDQGRYNEMRRRSGRKSPVLRMIDRECFKTLGANRGELSENTMTPLLRVAELRSLFVQASIYVSGLPKLYVSYFNIAPEIAVDMVMAVDDPEGRLGALRETMKAAIESGRGHAFLTLFLDVIGSLAFYQNIRDEVLRLLVDVLVFINGTTSNPKGGDNGGVDLEGWLSEFFVSVKIEEVISKPLFSPEDVDGSGKDAHTIMSLLIAEDVAERIEDPEERVRALAGVAGALARAGETERARRVAENAVNTAERIKGPWARARALAEAAGALARAGLTDEALTVAERIEDPEERARALAEAADALAQAGAIDEAREIVTMIDESSSRSRAQSAVIKALVRKSSSNAAVNMLRAALAEVEGFVSRQDAADCCATLAAACVDAADLLADSADAEPAERDRWLGLARSALARSWLYGASVWDRFDVLLRVAPDLATRLVEERLLADPEPSPDPDPNPGSEPRPGPDPEGPGGGTPSSS